MPPSWSRSPGSGAAPSPPAGAVAPSRGNAAVRRGLAVVAAWFLAAAALAVWLTSWLADQDTSHCEDGSWCGVGVFLAAVAFAVWAGLVLLFGLGIALTTLVVITRRIRTGLGAGHLAVGAGLVGGAIWATAVLVAAGFLAFGSQ